MYAGHLAWKDEFEDPPLLDAENNFREEVITMSRINPTIKNHFEYVIVVYNELTGPIWAQYLLLIEI